MKKILFGVILLGLLTGCSRGYVKYEIIYEHKVPDSLKNEHRDYLLELVKAASNETSLSAGKAKHLDDILYSASHVTNDLYEERVEMIKKSYYNSDFLSATYDRSTYIKKEDLDRDKNEVYIYYKILELGKPYKIKLPRK